MPCLLIIFHNSIKWLCILGILRLYGANFFFRNLFFRTSNLLLIGAIPIFVLDGDAPQLKLVTIEKRLNINTEAPAKNNIVRKRLNTLQKQVRHKFS